MAVTLRRTFDASRLRLSDLRKLAVDAHALGLDDSAIVGLQSRYGGGGRGGGWKIDATVHGEPNGPINIVIEKSKPYVPVCPECLAGKCRACSNLAPDEDGEPTECRCTHGD